MPCAAVTQVTVLPTHRRRGLLAVDTDDPGWAMPDGTWDESRMGQLLARHQDVVVSGTVENQVHFYDRFEHVVLLSAPLAVLMQRLRDRTNNPYGKSPAERAAEGFIKVVTDAKGGILGASIVGQHAGELIQMWSLAVSQKLNIKAMTQWISPYPTFSEINKRVAYGYYATAAANPLVRKVVGWLRKLG